MPSNKQPNLDDIKKIPSAFQLMYDIYTMHTKRITRKNTQIKRVIKMYDLPDDIPYIGLWGFHDNYDYQDNLIEDVVVFLHQFLVRLGVLDVAGLTIESFNIQKFRENPAYTVHLIKETENILYSYHDEMVLSDKSSFIASIDYKYGEMSKLFQSCKGGSLDPFFVGLKEDLLKLFSFDASKAQIEYDVSNLNAEKTSEELEIQSDFDIKNELLKQLKRMTPTQFEKFSLYLIANITKEKDEDVKNLIIHNGQVGDGGIDGVLKVKSALNTYDTYLIQCKRYDSTSVGRPELQSFVGAMFGVQATKGIFITTSTFTKNALDYINNVKMLSIQTMGGAELVEYMIEHKIGVVEHISIQHCVDVDFFNNFMG